MNDRTDRLLAKLRVSKPGSPWTTWPRSTDAIDVTDIPQISDEDRVILSDPVHEGTQEQRDAHKRAMVVLREIRKRKGLPVDEIDE